MAYRLFSEYVDLGGNFLRASNWMGNPTGVGALRDALRGATNGNLIYYTYALPTIGTDAPADALYPLVADTAILNFATGAGTAVRVTVPAPVAEMFSPYGTIDASDAKAAAVIAAVIGCLSDNNGNLATLFKGGSRARRTVEQVGE